MPRRIRPSQAAAFGAEVRRRRLQAGLSLHQLAERAGVTPNYIGVVELGKRNPSLLVLEALARGLGVASGELLGGSTLAPKALEFARLFQESPSDLQSGVLKLLRTSADPALLASTPGDDPSKPWS
jgi:transcriptional regulator with XRE-family HTH domain